MCSKFKVGVKYKDGKVLFFKTLGNPEVGFAESPSWAVDIRELIAMFFVGMASLFFIYKGEYTNAMILLTGLMGYATGRTVPGGKS